MNLLKFLLLIICLSISSILLAQRKPIVKLEFAAGGMPNVVEIGRTIHFFPAIQVPITQHLDLGIGYNSIKFNTKEFDGYYVTPDTGQNFDLTRNYASLYITWNFSNLRRTINPVLGYIVSTTKGSSDFPGNSIYSVESKKNIQDKMQKSYVAHGAQAGVDVRLSRTISILVRARAYDLVISDSGNFFNSNGTPYTINYLYAMLGATININASKKRGVK